jgi:2-C-methyl-D-erythritol 4-phosphate cytidylyltransferase/2-C-methyl-D-erythritol 2,4-cyclodiphosphate synthase
VTGVSRDRVGHDAARPFTSPALVSRAIAAARRRDWRRVPGVPMTDTIREVDPPGT